MVAPKDMHAPKTAGAAGRPMPLAAVSFLPAFSLGEWLRKGIVEGDPFTMWVGVCLVSVATLVYVLVRVGRNQR